MENLTFRPLRADEVDVRVAQCKKNGVSLLLYKDARCDMNILDETVGPARWQRHHSRDNANCTVSIYIPEMDQWVEKEDTGTESNTEAEKGLASDSFKRACFNWGIGRELYTAPFIWIGSDSCDIKENGNRCSCYDRFRVTEMEVEAGRITRLAVANDSRKGAVVYRFGQPVQAAQEPRRRTERTSKPDTQAEPQKPAQGQTEASPEMITAFQAMKLEECTKALNINLPELLRRNKVAAAEQLTASQYTAIMTQIQAYEAKKGANK